MTSERIEAIEKCLLIMRYLSESDDKHSMIEYELVRRQAHKLFCEISNKEILDIH